MMLLAFKVLRSYPKGLKLSTVPTFLVSKLEGCYKIGSLPLQYAHTLLNGYLCYAYKSVFKLVCKESCYPDEITFGPPSCMWEVYTSLPSSLFRAA